MREQPRSTDLITVLPSSGAASFGKGVIGGLLRRCSDHHAVDAVVNHPDVRPFVGIGGPQGYLDHSSPVARPENWFLLGEHGGFGLIWTAPGVHEVHTFILKTGRGEWARAAARETINYARTSGDRMLWTRIHPAQVNVVAFATEMGMRPSGMTLETFGVPYLVFHMEID